MTEKLDSFSGSAGVVESPHDFFHIFQRIHLDTDEKVAISHFRFYVKVRQDADKWFTNLATEKREDWTTFEAAFVVHWPKKTWAVKKPGQYEDELMKLTLTTKSLGDKVDAGGVAVWAHVQWADDALDLATKAGLASSASYLHPVRRGLPNVIQDNIASEHMDWLTFTTDIRSIDIDTIQLYMDRKARDKVERAEELRAFMNSGREADRVGRMRASPNPAYPSQPIITLRITMPNPNAMGHFLGNYPSSTFAPAQDNTYTSQNAGRKPPNRTPPSKDEHRNLNCLLNLLPHHPPTPSGNELYRCQVADWSALHGQDARLSTTNPYPLRPGMAGICSGKCFRCGTHGHRSFECTLPRDMQVPRNETARHALCTCTLGTIRTPSAVPTTPTAINLVYVTDDMGRVHLEEDNTELDEAEFDQGKGEGSPA